MNGTDELLTLDEVAALLKCTRRQVLELTRSRAQVRSKHPLPVFKLNAKMLRVRRSDFAAWLEKISSGVREVHASTAPKRKGQVIPFSPDDIDTTVVRKLIERFKGRS
jgi:hypothetical protein